MRKLAIVLLVAGVMLSGCISDKFLGFLPTSDYVDKKADAVKADEDKQIAGLKAQLADYQKVKDQAQAAVDQVNQNQKTIQDLQALAKKVEGRLDQVPKEVIRQLIDALQAALNE